MQRQQHESDVQAQIGAFGHGAGEERQLLDILQRVASVVRAFGDAGETELVGMTDLFHALREPLRHIVFLGKLAADHQAELYFGHGFLLLDREC